MIWKKKKYKNKKKKNLGNKAEAFEPVPMKLQGWEETGFVISSSREQQSNQ